MSKHAQPPAPEPRRSSTPVPVPADAATHVPAAAHPGGAGPLWQAGNAAISQLLGGAGSGHPLPAPTQAAMEGAFNTDFGRVRVHDDAAAREAATRLGATAFTAGNEVYLGAGAPTPTSGAGQALLAHELAHVVQQRQAGTVRAGAVDGPGDRFEQAAEQAARQVAGGQRPTLAGAAGAPPAVQRQRTESPGLTRAEAQTLLTEFLQRHQTAQGGRSLKVTPAIELAILRMFAQDVMGSGSVEALLKSKDVPTSATSLAQKVASYLPANVDPARVAHLRGASAGSNARPSVAERVQGVGDMAGRTGAGEPDRPETPPGPSTEEKADKDASIARRLHGQGDPTTIGPGSVDVLRVWRVIEGLPEAWKHPQGRRVDAPAPEARAYPAIEQAIKQVAANALVPAEAKDAGDWDEAREVARDLARRLDVAQQQHQNSVDLHLSDGYNRVRDPAAITAALARIVQLIRDALPHHASEVRQVNVFFGNKLVRWIPVRATTE